MDRHYRGTIAPAGYPLRSSANNVLRTYQVADADYQILIDADYNGYPYFYATTFYDRRWIGRTPLPHYDTAVDHTVDGIMFQRCYISPWLAVPHCRWFLLPESSSFDEEQATGPPSAAEYVATVEYTATATSVPSIGPDDLSEPPDGDDEDELDPVGTDSEQSDVGGGGGASNEGIEPVRSMFRSILATAMTSVAIFLYF
jgi:hypothetical protein